MIILKIDTFELPVFSSFDLAQRYEPIGGETILRTISGIGVKQMSYQKRRIITSGTGWVPSGLNGLDFSVTHDIGCVVPETLPADFSTRSVELPDTIRIDSGHVPYGLAQMPGGQTVECSVTVDDLVATAAEVSGAVAYQIAYYPLITCWLMRPTSSGPDHSWELVAEEE